MIQLLLINKLKIQLKKKEISKRLISIIFKRCLVNEIIPFREGTIWSFEGYMSIPNKGEIACGYFVSITLKYFSVELNRYKLAQQSSINKAKISALGGI